MLTSLNARTLVSGAVIVSVICTSGCAGVIMPSIKTPDFNKVSAEDAASDVKNEIESKRQDYDEFDFYSSLLVYAAGLAGIGFGVYGAHRDSVIASALFGGGIQGLRTLIPIHERRQIYQQGSSAIECALATTRFDLPSDSNGEKLIQVAQEIQNHFNTILTEPTENIKDEISKYQTKFERSSPRSQNMPISSRLAVRQLTKFQTAIDNANMSVTGLVETMDQFNNNRDNLLKSAIGAIVEAVNAHIWDRRLDPNGALEAAIQKTSKPIEQISQSASNTEEAITALEKEASETATTAKAIQDGGIVEQKNAKSQPMRAKLVDDVTRDAEKIEDMADKVNNYALSVKSKIEMILARSKMPSACLGGLL